MEQPGKLLFVFFTLLDISAQTLSRVYKPAQAYPFLHQDDVHLVPLQMLPV